MCSVDKVGQMKIFEFERCYLGPISPNVGSICTKKIQVPYRPFLHFKDKECLVKLNPVIDMTKLENVGPNDMTHITIHNGSVIPLLFLIGF